MKVKFDKVKAVLTKERVDKGIDAVATASLVLVNATNSTKVLAASKVLSKTLTVLRVVNSYRKD